MQGGIKMDFEKILEQAKKTVKKAVKVTVKASNDVIDYGKSKIRISTLNDKIEENYKVIGESVFNKNVYDIDCDTEKLENLCKEIVEMKEEIALLTASLKKSEESDEEVVEEEVNEEDFE